MQREHDDRDEPETVSDLVEDLAEEYGLDPNQRISTLIEAGRDDLLEEIDDSDSDDTGEFEDDD